MDRTLKRLGCLLGGDEMDGFNPDTVEDLQRILKDLEDDMGVEADPNCGIDAKTVGELRQVQRMPSRPITVVVPHPIYPESVVEVTERGLD